MKLFKSRKFSLVMAIVFILSTMSFTAMADTTTVAADFTIIESESDLGTLTNANGSMADDYKIITNKAYTDDLTGETVLKYSATLYGADTGSWNVAGNEPRVALNTAFAEADFTSDNYGYVKIAFDIYIANATDGLAFRMKRFSTADDTLGNWCYIGVGGSDFTAGGGTIAAECINTSLTTGAWHKVVIELGANSTNRDVIFHIDGLSTKCETQLPADTYGFGGDNGNQCVMIPKGADESPFEIRLNNFSIIATNAKPDYNIFNYESLTNKTFTTKSTSSATEVAANEFSTAYGKTAMNVKNTGTAALSGTAGSEIGWTLTDDAASTDVVSLGGLDWSEYKNLRIQFNAYFGYENIAYIRFLRSTDSCVTYPKTNSKHIVGVGTIAKPGLANTNTANTGSGNTTGCLYRYRGMEPNMWHNVVMELGANKDNTYINVYVDGVKVALDNNVTTLGNATTEEGFGSTGPNYLHMAFRDTTDSLLDVQINDFSVTACNAMYDPTTNVPSIDGVISCGVTYRVDAESKDIKYIDGNDEDGMSVADFKTTNVDHLNAVGTNEKVLAYNETSNRVAYYTLTEQTDLEISEVTPVTKDGRLYVQFDYNNETTKVNPVRAIVAYYKNDALVYVDPSSVVNLPVGLAAASVDVKLPATDYDTIKVFVWDDMTSAAPIKGMQSIAVN